MSLNAQFFAALRSSMFPPIAGIPQTVVDSCNTVCAAFDSFSGHDHCTDDLAYILATVRRECGPTAMDLAIREIGLGRGKAYGVAAGPYGKVYYGRGPCQTTWLANYQKEKLRLGYDFVQDPDKLLDPHTGAVAMIDGMYGGIYTGKSLRSYITPGKVTTHADFVQCRRIINGLDHADAVADDAVLFQTALLNGYDKPVNTLLAQTGQSTTSQPTPQQPPRRGLVWEIGRLFGKA